MQEFAVLFGVNQHDIKEDIANSRDTAVFKSVKVKVKWGQG